MSVASISLGAGRIGRATLLATLLGLHLITRLQGQATIPLSERHFYPTSYLVSLSLLTGNGFTYLLPREANPPDVAAKSTSLRDSSDKPADRVMDFIAARGQERLSGQDIADYLSGGVRAVPIDNLGLGSNARGFLEASRVLDIYLTAGLWKVFGVSWSVLFTFYALVSTMVNLMVFFIARHVGRSYWCGVLGSAGFLASSLETYGCVYSIRDTNPLWFDAIAFFVLFLSWRPRPSRVVSCLRWMAIGASALIGLGWRSDAHLAALFILVALVVLLVVAHYPPRQVAIAVTCYLAGCLAVKSVIGWLGPVSYRPGKSEVSVVGGRSDLLTGVFHVAWYGEHARSQLLSMENAFQAVQSDYMTLYQSNYYGQQRRNSTGEFAPSRDLDDPAQFRRCRSMYLEMAAYHLYGWWQGFPRILAYAIGVDQPVQPGASVYGNGGGAIQKFLEGRPPWLRAVYRWCLDPYRRCVPYLFVIGVVGALLIAEGRARALPLAVFFVYYAVTLFLVLPEAKHWAPLLLPLHVFAALGLCFLLKGLGSWRRAIPSDSEWKRQVSRALVVLALLTAGWVLLGFVTYGISRAQRHRLVESILSRVPDEPQGETLDGKRLFSVHTAAQATGRPVGYLLKVRGGGRPQDLVCVHVREATGSSRALVYWTRHRIKPHRDQFFFVNLVNGTRIGDDRPYTLLVRLYGGARFVSGTTIDLSQWDIGLPLSLVLEEHDAEAGSSWLGEGALATDSAEMTLEAVMAWLASAE